LKDAKVDTVILGCTHYPLLRGVIQKVMGPGVTLIDSAKQVAIEVKKILAQEGLTNHSKGAGKHKFFVSDNPEWFSELGRKFLDRPVGTVQKVNV
jgi:glutamate racemase